MLTDADVFGPQAGSERVAAGKVTDVTLPTEDDEPEVLDAESGPQVDVAVVEDDIFDLIEPTPGWGETRKSEVVLENFCGMRLEIRVPTDQALTALSFAGAARMSPERQQRIFAAFFQQHMSPNTWDGLTMRMMNPDRDVPIDIHQRLAVRLTELRGERNKAGQAKKGA
jgi:hypothetical protein